MLIGPELKSIRQILIEKELYPTIYLLWDVTKNKWCIVGEKLITGSLINSFYTHFEFSPYYNWRGYKSKYCKNLYNN